MIELFILFFTITFALSFGWVMGKRMGNLLGSQIEVWWDKMMDFLKRIPHFFRLIPVLVKGIWYWKFRRPKLVETMRKEAKTDNAIWALAERLKYTKHEREQNSL